MNAETKNKLIQSSKVWIAIYPSIILINYLLGGVLNGLPMAVRTLILTIILVPSMVFILLPLINKIFKKIL